jgi:hypothetical protein
MYVPTIWPGEHPTRLGAFARQQAGLRVGEGLDLRQAWSIERGDSLELFQRLAEGRLRSRPNQGSVVAVRLPARR